MQTVREGCPDELVCFAIEDAAQIAAWVGEIRTWARQAEIACGVKEEKGETDETDPE